MINILFYEEEAKKRGLPYYFIENSTFSLTTSNVKIEEKLSFIEDINGKKYQAIAIVKNVPISKYTENKNKRIYSRKLWEKVLKEGTAEGTLSLADHPEGEGSVKDIWGVWHNLKVNENNVTCDLYLIEEKPVKILKAGGKLGTSTVAYGELAEDGMTVVAESFQLDRVSDIVLNPSQDTFATYENLELEENFNIKNINENTNNKVFESKMREYNMIDKITEANLKNNVRVAIKEAQNNENIKEAIEDLKAIKETIPVEMLETHQKLDQNIELLTSKMEEKLKDAGKLIEEKQNSLEEITTKYETLEAAYNQLKEDYVRAKNIIEKANIDENTDVNSLKESLNLKEKELKVLKENEEKMLADINNFEEDVSVMENDIKQFMKDRILMEKDIEMFNKQVNKLKKECSILNKKVKKYKEEYMGGLEVNPATGESDYVVADEDLDVEDLDWDETEYDPQDEVGTYDEMDEIGEVEIQEKEEDDDKEDEEEIKEEEADDDSEKEDEEDEEMKEEEEEDLEKEDKEKEKVTKKEESRKMRVYKPIYEFYKKELKKTPAIKDIRKEIFVSKSLYEAVNKVKTFKDKRNRKKEIMNLKESGYEIPKKINKYVFKR